MVNLIVLSRLIFFTHISIKASSPSSISSDPFMMISKSKKRFPENTTNVSLSNNNFKKMKFNTESSLLIFNQSTISNKGEKNKSNSELFYSTPMESNERIKKSDSLYFPSETTLFIERTTEYNSNLEEILSTFFIKDLFKEIIKYSHENPIQDSYDKVMTILCKDNPTFSFCKSLISIKFDTVDDLEKSLIDMKFMNNFRILIEDFRFKYGSFFSMNLYSFLLKSILIMRQRYPNHQGQDQWKWERIIKSTKSLIYLFEYRDIKNFISVFEWNPIHLHNWSLNFLKLECLRNWKNDLEPRFKDLLNDFYSVERGSCSALISKHFNEGNEIAWNEIVSIENFKSYFNRNPLLAFLWKYRDPNSWIKCCNSLKILDSYSNSKWEMENFKWKRKEILTFDFDLFSLFGLELELKLVLENNHKIIFHSLNLDKQYIFKIAKILKSLNRLTWKNLLNVFTFEIIDENLNHSKLKKFLDSIDPSGMNDFSIYNEIMKSMIDYENDWRKHDQRHAFLNIQ